MKRFNHTIGFFAAAALAACTGDFESFNTNPDAVQSVDKKTYITTMQMDAVIPCSDVGANEFQRACNLMGDAFGGYLSPIQAFNGGKDRGAIKRGRLKKDGVGRADSRTSRPQGRHRLLRKQQGSYYANLRVDIAVYGGRKRKQRFLLGFFIHVIFSRFFHTAPFFHHNALEPYINNRFKEQQGANLQTNGAAHAEPPRRSCKQRTRADALRTLKKRSKPCAPTESTPLSSSR